MRKKKIGAIAMKSFALLVVLATAYQVIAQDAAMPYPKADVPSPFLLASKRLLKGWASPQFLQ
jgi:hypothetical protein